MLFYETEARKEGYKTIAGVDEAGRGPLAGPVTAAAVILPKGASIPGCDDSKKLSPRTREKLFDDIYEIAIAVSCYHVEPEIIDQINILQATRLAMKKAVEELTEKPDLILIDGNQKIDWQGSQKTIIKGDALSLSIAAASIIAKVIRDRIMLEYDRKYPEYGFCRHKGYGVREHLSAIKRLGPTPIHRVSFKGVKKEEAVLPAQNARVKIPEGGLNDLDDKKGRAVDP